MCVTGYRYITHLYCLAVQAGFYSDVVECWPVTQTAQVRSPAAVLVIRIFSPACTARQYKCVIYLYPVTCVWFVHVHIIRKLHTKLPCFICVQLCANVTHYHCHVLHMCYVCVKLYAYVTIYYVFVRVTYAYWLRPTGDQEVAGSTPAEVGNILSWRLIMKYFLRSFSPFRWFKKGSCQFLAKECAQYWLTV